MSRKGILYIIAAPSGAGKTSLVKALSETLNDIKISISYTTRPPRPADRDGIDYRFVSEAQFKAMIEDKAFLEHAEVYGHLYGTSHKWVLKQLDKGVDVLLEIDWQGARQIRQSFTDAVSIFILPPSTKVLLQRLQTRQQDDVDVIHQRMTMAKHEIAHYHEFDYLVVNDDFKKALKDLQHIVRAKRLEVVNQEHVLADLLADLEKKR